MSRLLLITLLCVSFACGQTAQRNDINQLVKAIQQRNMAGVRAILDKGIDLNSRTASGGTPLGEAISDGLYDLAQQLVLAGADPNLAEGGGVTPLMHAAWSCNISIAKFMLEHGAAINATDNDGYTPLMNAAWVCDDDRMIDLLLAAGAAVNAQSQRREYCSDISFVQWE